MAQVKDAPLQVLNQRHFSILETLYMLDGGCFSHLAYWLWPEAKSLSRAYDAVRQLVQGGYLISKRLPPLGQKGSGEAWLWLSRKGRDALGDRLPLDEAQETTPSAPPVESAHAIAVRDFHLLLQRVCGSSNRAILSRWINERPHNRQPIVVTDPATQLPAKLVPDGSFVLRYPSGRSAEFFLEWDRDTIHVTRMRLKIRGYQAMIAAGPRRPVVLFVVPSPKRRNEIKRWVDEEAAAWFAESQIEVRDYFWTALSSEATEEKLLGPIWETARAGFVSLLVMGQPRGRTRLEKVTRDQP